MKINSYQEMNGFGMDILRELGSIGTGNAVTALSNIIATPISMSLPEVKIMEYTPAVEFLGGPEKIVAAVLVQMTGEFSGIILYMLDLDFVNMVLERLSLGTIKDFSEVDELRASAVAEVSNIIISSYAGALGKLADISVNLSVPAMSINMLGGIMSVPMVQYGYVTDKIMLVDGKCTYSGGEMASHLIMMPDIESLNFLMEKLGGTEDE
ncbi:MAG: chemotaxis protein CheC [Anaerotignum sp.]